MKKRRLPHQFRFQVFAEWIGKQYLPCRVADVGGGKGLLSFLLDQKDFDCVVIDPVWQKLTHKYRDLESGKRVRLARAQQEGLTRLNKQFEVRDGANFDLLIGLHAHGSNMKIIQAAAEFKKSFAILPCCVVDEPIVKRAGVNWLDSLFSYAQSLGLLPQKEKLGFVGQDMVLWVKKG